MRGNICPLCDRKITAANPFHKGTEGCEVCRVAMKAYSDYKAANELTGPHVSYMSVMNQIARHVAITQLRAYHERIESEMRGEL